MSRPYQQRRAYATCKKLWPEVDVTAGQRIPGVGSGRRRNLVDHCRVNIIEGRAAEAFAETMRSVGLNGLDAVPGELSTFGHADDLGRLILDVAQASLRVDQLRWLAVRQPRVRFVDQVTERVKVWAGRERQVSRDARSAVASSAPVAVSRPPT